MKEIIKSNLILFNVSFFEIIKLASKKNKKNNIYYINSSSFNVGLDIYLSTKIIGKRRTSKLLILLAKFFGVCIKNLPDRNEILNYPEIFLKSQTSTLKIVSRLLDDKELTEEIHILNSELKNKNSKKSISGKYLSIILFSLIENIELLKSLGKNKLTVVNFPRNLNSKLSKILNEEYDLNIFYEQKYAFSPIIAFLFLIRGLYLVLISLIRNRRKIKSFNGFKYITEFYGLDHFNKKVGHVNYFELDPQLEGEFIYYVSSKNKRFLNKDSVLSIKKNKKIIELSDYVVTKKNFSIFLKLFSNLIIKSLYSRLKVKHFVNQLFDIEKYLAFSNILKIDEFKCHIYYLFPPGPTSVVEDSGLVTELCNKNNLQNISIQTRTHYSDTYIYYYNYDNIRLTWSSVWDKRYKDKNFIEKYIEIGNLFSSNQNNIRSNNQKSKNLVLFLSDLDTTFDSTMYTLNYTLNFLDIIFKAVSLLKRRNFIDYQVLIKPKEIWHHKIISENQRFRTIVNENNINPKFILVNKGQKITDIINDGNIFLSIGFTTPFFDCLAALKPSAYVFPYNLENVRIPIKRKLILKTEEEICEFLLDAKVLPEDEVNIYNRKKFNNPRLEISNLFKEL